MNSRSHETILRAGIRSRSALLGRLSGNQKLASTTIASGTLTAPAHAGVVLTAELLSQSAITSPTFGFLAFEGARATIKAGLLNTPIGTSYEHSQAPTDYHSNLTETAGTGQLGWVSYRDTDFEQFIGANERTLLAIPDNIAVNVSNLATELQGHEFFSGGVFRPYGAPGGKYRLRLNATCVSTLINTDIHFEMDIGGSWGVIENATEMTYVEAGVATILTPSFDFFAFDTFITNGGAIYITARADMTLTNLTLLVTVEAL